MMIYYLVCLDHLGRSLRDESLKLVIGSIGECFFENVNMLAFSGKVYNDPFFLDELIEEKRNVWIFLVRDDQKHLIINRQEVIQAFQNRVARLAKAPAPEQITSWQIFDELTRE